MQWNCLTRGVLYPWPIPRYFQETLGSDYHTKYPTYKKQTIKQNHEPVVFEWQQIFKVQIHWTTYKKKAYAIIHKFQTMKYLLRAPKLLHS